MSRFFQTKKTRNNFLLLTVCNVLFIVWLRHVGYIHMAMFFITCLVVTNTLALYSNKRTSGYRAGRNYLIASAGPLLMVYGKTQTSIYMDAVGKGVQNGHVGNPLGLLYTLIGAIIMIIPLVNANSDVGADVVIHILDPQEEILTGKKKVIFFFWHTIKGIIYLAIFASLFFYWKQKQIESRDRDIRASIAKADRRIDICDNNVKLALEMGYGNAQQWREQSARYAEYKAKLEAELSTASQTGNPETASSAHGGSDTIPQPTDPKYYR